MELKEIIRKRLKQDYPPEKAEEIWERFQLQYVDFLRDLPYQGGKRCTHNGAAGTYDCIAMFAYYEVSEKKPSLEEMYNMLNEALLPPFRRLGKLVNANHPVLLWLIHKAFYITSLKDRRYEKTCPTGYLMHVARYDKKKGIYYRFDRCPIAEFARAHGYLDLMPAFCNGDYPALKEIHAGLIRQNTCSNSNYCGYWIVGDQSPWLKKYPMETDEKGYYFNRVNKTEDHPRR